MRAVAGAVIVLAGAILWGASMFAKSEDHLALSISGLIYSSIGWLMLIGGALENRRPPA